MPAMTIEQLPQSPWCKHCGKLQTKSFLLKHQHICRSNPLNQVLAEPYPIGCPVLAVCEHTYCQLLRNSGRRGRYSALGYFVK